MLYLEPGSLYCFIAISYSFEIFDALDHFKIPSDCRYVRPERKLSRQFAFHLKDPLPRRGSWFEGDSTLPFVVYLMCFDIFRPIFF